MKYENLKIGDLFNDLDETYTLFLINERIYMMCLLNGYLIFCADVGNGWYHVLEINNNYVTYK